MQDLLFIKFLNHFIDNPYEEVYLREISRKMKISPYAVKRYADILVKEGLLLEQKKANLRYFRPNVNSLFFKSLKLSFNLREIIKSGLIEYLKEKVSGLSSIVLFGSMAKGENDKKSDCDILVIGKETKESMSHIEKKMGREINIHFFSWTEWNAQIKKNKAFYFDVVTYGKSLYGEMPVIK